MTAKVKATELVSIMTFNCRECDNNFKAKQCALILVDEILLSNNQLLKLDSIGVVFWNQVKKEIENYYNENFIK